MKLGVQVKNIAVVIEDDMGNVVMDYSAENYHMNLDVAGLGNEVAKLVESVMRVAEDAS